MITDVFIFVIFVVSFIFFFFFFFFFNDTATTEIYTLSLHDALPILQEGRPVRGARRLHANLPQAAHGGLRAELRRVEGQEIRCDRLHGGERYFRADRLGQGFRRRWQDHDAGRRQRRVRQESGPRYRPQRAWSRRSLQALLDDRRGRRVEV